MHLNSFSLGWNCKLVVIISGFGTGGGGGGSGWATETTGLMYKTDSVVSQSKNEHLNKQYFVVIKAIFYFKKSNCHIKYNK